jgi:hypothetical protein
VSKLNIFLAASFLLLAAPLHAAPFRLTTTDEIAGIWNAQVAIRGQIATVGSFTEGGPATCTIQSTGSTAASVSCSEQGNDTTPLSSGHLIIANNGKKLRWGIDSTTNIEADILERVIAGLQAKGKSFDPTAVRVSLTGEGYTPFKVLNTNQLSNGKAVIKARAVAVINGKRKALKVTYTITSLSLTR